MDENSIIARLQQRLAACSSAELSIGDDCAVINPLQCPELAAAVAARGAAQLGEWRMVLKVDSIVQGRHFLPQHAGERVGWKALARCLSDFAAMGAYPQSALVAVAMSDESYVPKLERIYDGLARCAQTYGVEVVGGELSRLQGEGLVISVSLSGWVEAGHYVRRSGASQGEYIVVSGALGGSIAGKHLDFQPRLAEGQWLARKGIATAMMDISDGLARDLPRLAAASGVGFELDYAAIPRSPGCELQQALGDGEDFELLFCCRDLEWLGEWQQNFAAVPLTVIGRTQAASTQALSGGFDHFERV